MDSLEVSKLVGAGCAALLAFLVFNTAAKGLIGTEQAETPAFAMAAAEAGDHGGDAGESKPIEELLATADAAKGEKVFAKCKSCHTVDNGGRDGTGPNLWGVVGRPVGKHGDFSYSGDMAAHGGDWTFAELNAFLTNPKGLIKGTKMGFAGLRKEEERANLLLWLNQQSSAPLPIQ